MGTELIRFNIVNIMVTEAHDIDYAAAEKKYMTTWKRANSD